MPSDHDNPRLSSTGATRRSGACLCVILCFVLLGCQSSPVKSNPPTPSNPKLTAALAEATAGIDPPASSLNEIQTLDLSHRRLESLNGIEQCSNLRSLDVSAQFCAEGLGCRGPRLDISALSKLTHLEKLSIGANYGIDFTPIAELKSLRSLDVISCELSDFHWFTKLDGLTEIDLAGNSITQIATFGDATKLEVLCLAANPLVSCPPFTELPKLRVLELGETDLTFIYGLSEFNYLETLSVSYSPITSLDGVEFLPNLKELRIVGTQLPEQRIREIRKALEQRGVVVQVE